MATPLHWATRAGLFSTVVLLMQYGADPNLTDGDGLACIHLAAQYRFSGILAYFIAKGVNINMQDSGGMTALMWSAYRATSMDPTRMLLTFGACTTIQDCIHGNTALHWAIVACNTNAITALVLRGASLNIANNAGQTPLDLLKNNKDMFFNDKVTEKLEEVTQENRPLTLMQRIMRDKKLRFWVMAATPVTGIYIIGQLFQSSIPLPLKFGGLLLGYILVYFIRPYICDDRLFSILPLATVFATKMWVYVTWFLWIMPHVSVWITVVMLTSSMLLWYNFLKVWKGDPGVISSTQEEKYRVIIQEAEREGFDSGFFCSSCLVHRPLRSKHCGICDRCIAKHDHHCPWVANCIGEKNHKHFIGYLFMLLVTILIMIYGTTQFWDSACSLQNSSQNFFSGVINLSQCDAWVMWITFNVGVHAIWVFLLLNCQMYQIIFLGMTTNERLNHTRYRHFHQSGVTQSPFHRGYFQNLVDFLGWRCFGLLKPDQTDWSQRFQVRSSVDQFPLLETKDNYQYV